ncbi:MAG: DUF370 domain-containing protein [Oscillospiraceae bacterium]|nr:DUF370 domain-containing protein [Oscillospiraceae bacterium]
MFLHLGGDVTVRSSEVIGVFDIEACSVSKITVDYLNGCQKNKQIVNISDDMPKSFIVAENKTYISNVACGTIKKRM